MSRGMPIAAVLFNGANANTAPCVFLSWAQKEKAEPGHP
jgi:hypothetical protein